MALNAVTFGSSCELMKEYFAACVRRKRARVPRSFGERIYELKGSNDSEYNPFKRARKLEEPILPKVKPVILRKEDYIKWLREKVGYQVPQLPPIKVEPPSLPPLSESDRNKAEALLDMDKLAHVCVVDKVELRGKDFLTLKHPNWLNDEIINSYVKLLSKIEVADHKVFMFNTFFWTSITSDGSHLDELVYNYSKVRRWTKRQNVDIFAYDLVIFPLNLGGTHWTTGSIDIGSKRVRIYDSMMKESNLKQFEEVMCRYVADEYMDKKGSCLPDEATWQLEPVTGHPLQDNGFDCGVFTCKYLECLAFNAPFHFSQSDIADTRLRMALELFEGSIRDRTM